MANCLEEELHALICFVEIQVDDTREHENAYMQRHRLAMEYRPEELQRQIEAYKRRYEAIQDDGTEDDIAYIRLINYNQKVVTNNMMQSFLGSRVARFLGACHPYKHTVYLTAAGQSEYNEAGKIGGNSALSALGREFALRLAEFSEIVVCGQVESFSCVTLALEEIGSLRDRLTKVPASGAHGGVFARGGWSDVADVGGSATLREGMRLVRLRSGQSSEFVDAPPSIEAVLELAGAGPVTLVFVDGTGTAAATRARLWTSALLVAQQTVAHVRHPTMHLENARIWKQMAPQEYRNLDEVYAGEYEGLTCDDIKQRQPKEAELRNLDKLGYRYPRGESYYDVIARLDDYILQLETVQEPVMIVSHQAVLRVIYAYLAGIPREMATEVDIPRHTVIKIAFDGTGGMRESRFFLGPRTSE